MLNTCLFHVSDTKFKRVVGNIPDVKFFCVVGIKHAM